MWPADPEAQAYLVTTAALAVTCVGLLWTLFAERRHLLGKLGRQGERAHAQQAKLRANWYAAEAELADMRREADRSFDQHVASAPTVVDLTPRHAERTAVQQIVKPFTAPTGSFPAITSVVVDGSIDPDTTSRIYVADYDGSDTP